MIGIVKKEMPSIKALVAEEDVFKRLLEAVKNDEELSERLNSSLQDVELCHNYYLNQQGILR
jgi:hypothetical protein